MAKQTMIRSEMESAEEFDFAALEDGDIAELDYDPSVPSDLVDTPDERETKRVVVRAEHGDEAWFDTGNADIRVDDTGTGFDGGNGQVVAVDVKIRHNSAADDDPVNEPNPSDPDFGDYEPRTIGETARSCNWSKELIAEKCGFDSVTEALETAMDNGWTDLREVLWAADYKN